MQVGENVPTANICAYMLNIANMRQYASLLRQFPNQNHLRGCIILTGIVIVFSSCWGCAQVELKNAVTKLDIPGFHVWQSQNPNVWPQNLNLGNEYTTGCNRTVTLRSHLDSWKPQFEVSETEICLSYFSTQPLHFFITLVLVEWAPQFIITFK